MKITEDNVRKIIREELLRLMEQDDPKPAKLDDLEFASEERAAYEAWVKQNRQVSSELKSTMVDYFVDQGLQDAHDLHKKLADEFGFDHDELMATMERRLPKEEDAEAEQSAKILDLEKVMEALQKL
tara:strand:- start:1326 stop:1706 length:381 start_codon:yes stop_codon:yes gene_type:complete